MMVAYNFQGRFAEAVESGKKCRTFRRFRQGRSRHARPGEPVQLYTGQRTALCRKLMDPDPLCESVTGYWLVRVIAPLYPGYDLDFYLYRVGEAHPLNARAVEAIALSDGFGSAAEFFEFFDGAYGVESSLRLVEIAWGSPPVLAGKGGRRNEVQITIPQ
jgi:hypothetical protein